MFCSTIRELREAAARADAIDVVIMSSMLQALPTTTLDELVVLGRPSSWLCPTRQPLAGCSCPYRALVPVHGLDPTPLA